MVRLSAFEAVLLIVGITAAFLGFRLISQIYNSEGALSWLMVISIFNWLILLVLFILLSLTVDTSRKELEELKKLVILLGKKKGKL